MAYYDQYRSGEQQPTYPPQQYPDPAEAAYNPYDNPQPHQTYEQAGYGYQEPGYGGYRDEPALPAVATEEKRERSGFENEGYVARAREPKTSRAMRNWRYEHQGNLWTGGSRARCCGRFFCCTILIFLFLLVSIVLSLLLWVKPPNVVIGEVAPVSTNGSVFQIQNNPTGLIIDLGVPIAVNNPNIFSVKFDSINAKIFYPLNNNSTDIGGGTLNNLVIQDNKQTNFTLPFNLNYTEAIDPNNAILLDIVQRCFVDTSNEITVNYEIDLSFKVLFIPIKPTIKNSASFKCPISANDIADLLKSAGINIPDLSTLLSALL